jgi:hypothetical protein
VPGGVRNIIAFNDQNDLEEKPDPANVHMISGTFPGALLSFKFFMDRSFLKKLSKNELEVSL